MTSPAVLKLVYVLVQRSPQITEFISLKLKWLYYLIHAMCPCLPGRLSHRAFDDTLSVSLLPLVYSVLLI